MGSGNAYPAADPSMAAADRSVALRGIDLGASHIRPLPVGRRYSGIVHAVFGDRLRQSQKHESLHYSGVVHRSSGFGAGGMDHVQWTAAHRRQSAYMEQLEWLKSEWRYGHGRHSRFHLRRNIHVGSRRHDGAIHAGTDADFRSMHYFHRHCSVLAARPSGNRLHDAGTQ